MTKYATLIKRAPHTADTDEVLNSGRWSWAGYSQADNPTEAAVGLAVSVSGYDEEEFESQEDIVRQFIDDGWRFKLLEIGEEYNNTDIP